MSAYTTSYSIRYGTPSLQEQIEVAVVTAAVAIQNEDPTTPNHAARLVWANWVMGNSSVALNPFTWPVAMNPTIVTAMQADPTGASVPDSDVQFVVNSNLAAVVAQFTPPA
jgi:hypothetical protein